MKTLRALLILACLCFASARPARAQFSSDLPGIPRASVTRLGPSQGRFEQQYSWMKLADTTALGARIGFGRTWRIMANFELGYDVTLGDAQLIRQPGPDAVGTGADERDDRVLATMAYGLKIGAKVRPISFVSPDGYGLELALGIAVQPAIKPVYWRESYQDSAWSGGLVRKEDDEPQLHPGGRVAAARQLMAVVSYRAPRVTADVAVIHESSTWEGRLLTPAFAGTVLRAGGGVSDRPDDRRGRRLVGARRAALA